MNTDYRGSNENENNMLKEFEDATSRNHGRTREYLAEFDSNINYSSKSRKGPNFDSLEDLQDNQDIDFSMNKKKKRVNTKHKVTNSKKQTKTNIGYGLKGGPNKGRKCQKKFEREIKLYIYVPEVDIQIPFTTEISKYKCMDEFIDDCINYYNQHSENPLPTPNENLRYVLMDYAQANMIQEVTSLTNNANYNLVTTSAYRKRSMKCSQKKIDKEYEELDDLSMLDNKEEEDFCLSEESNISTYKVGANNFLNPLFQSNTPQSSQSTIKSCYVGIEANLTPEIKEELSIKTEKAGNLIQGSFGMGQGVDKLNEFSQTHSHLIKKHLPGYLDQNSGDSLESITSQLEKLEVSGNNYSMALLNFIMSFKKANGIMTESGVETSIITKSEDPIDMLEYMKLFQEYLTLGSGVLNRYGQDSFSNWDRQSKALRMLGHQSTVVKKEVMKDVQNTHHYLTAQPEEMIFLVCKKTDKLKNSMKIHASHRGFELLCESWEDPNTKFPILQFGCCNLGKTTEGDPLRCRFYLKFKFIPENIAASIKGQTVKGREIAGRFIIDNYQVLHCHPVNKNVTKDIKFDINGNIDKVNELSHKKSIGIQCDTNLSLSSNKLYLSEFSQQMEAEDPDANPPTENPYDILSTNSSSQMSSINLGNPYGFQSLPL
ncbi:unnamed protein product [Moneuplotes crassus]|uniref:Uncharacterized protein n=1 Tax=Euplotes crassus TaxID=5936 RepID=A0AAD1U4Q5_EUPCR|nr:unnamed protein product [Moneuplotes crassus]